MKLKVEVKSWNDYPHNTHTSGVGPEVCVCVCGGGGGAYKTYFASKDNY